MTQHYFYQNKTKYELISNHNDLSKENSSRNRYPSNHTITQYGMVINYEILSWKDKLSYLKM